MTMTFAPAAGRDEAVAFYRRELGRDVDVEDEEILVARRGDEIVGALRLYPEAGTLLLRTMVVAAALRGRGFGRELLRYADTVIGERECYCFAWSHLEPFYGEIGFRRIGESQLPAPLRHRLGTPNTIVMRRAGRP